MHPQYVLVALPVDYIAPGLTKMKLLQPSFDTATKTGLAERRTRVRETTSADVSLLGCHRLMYEIIFEFAAEPR